MMLPNKAIFLPRKASHVIISAYLHVQSSLVRPISHPTSNISAVVVFILQIGIEMPLAHASVATYPPASSDYLRFRTQACRDIHTRTRSRARASGLKPTGDRTDGRPSTASGRRDQGMRNNGVRKQLVPIVRRSFFALMPLCCPSGVVWCGPHSGMLPGLLTTLAPEHGWRESTPKAAVWSSERAAAGMGR